MVSLGELPLSMVTGTDPLRPSSNDKHDHAVIPVQLCGDKVLVGGDLSTPPSHSQGEGAHPTPCYTDPRGGGDVASHPHFNQPDTSTSQNSMDTCAPIYPYQHHGFPKP
jgi:hypothetical protein